MDALAGLGLWVQVLILFILFIHVGFGWSRKTIETGRWGNMDTQDRQDKGEKREKHCTPIGQSTARSALVVETP